MKNILQQENNIILPKVKEEILIPGKSNFNTIILSNENYKKLLFNAGIKNYIIDANSNIEFFYDISLKEEEYTLKIENDKCIIKSNSDSGFFYGVISFKILLKQYKNFIPNIYIKDWPDLKIRGVMLDISRDKIPKLETLYEIVDVLKDIKINHFELYIEGYSFEYSSFKKLWEKTETPITQMEIKKLQKYCNERFIDLVGNQNCFGHMDRWLKEDCYKELAENFSPVIVQGGLHTSFGTTLDPLNPKSLELINLIFDDIVPHFSSTLFNVNLDEPYELGTGKSKQVAEEYGVGKIYLDYSMKIYKLINKYNKRMMMWGDIIYKNPGIGKLFPKDIIMLEWGYNSYHPFEKHASFFKDSGNEFILCPGTGTWGAITGRTDNMMKNITEACRVAVKYGALGILNTEWGNCGHMQTPAMSYPGHILAGALSWSYKELSDKEFENFLNIVIYDDENLELAKIILDFGRYRQYEDLERETRTMAMTSFERGIKEEDIKDEFLNIWKNLSEDEKNLEKNLVLKNTIESIREFRHEELLKYVNLLFNKMKKIKFKSKIKIQNQYEVAKYIIESGTLARYYLLNKKNLEKNLKKNLLKNIIDKIDYLIPLYIKNWLEENKKGGLDRSLNYFIKLKKELQEELLKI